MSMRPLKLVSEFLDVAKHWVSTNISSENANGFKTLTLLI